ncbi:choice-of-anchor I family protein [Oxynema sp. CENA135]|uniref:choice-of-anchor I family protein n=1 Tax=Oxynema sp. CENA135 TaxID=984206 RepID=UPI001F3749BD|nr:choice-of-anchor I family protein [Oxynema sp. CENA135]
MKISNSSQTCSHSIGKLLKFSLPSALIWTGLATAANAFDLRPIGTYQTGIFDDSGARITTYDPLSQRLFVTNDSTQRIEILDIFDPTNPYPVAANPFIDLTTLDLGLDFEVGGINSIAFKDGILAAAVESKTLQDPGRVLFFDSNGTLLNSLTVGALPDMLTFTPDGRKILVANEGEPSGDYLNDPEGSVSIIELAADIASLTDANVKTADFQLFNNIAIDDRIRIFGPNATVAQDLEPESIAVSEDGTKAWVTLQENNAIAVLDLLTGEFTDLFALGFKDYSQPQNALDPSDRDGGINFRTLQNLFGIYQPDEIASYTFGGQTFLFTANEGDSREYLFEDEAGNEIESLVEETSVGDVLLDPDLFPNAAEIQQNSNFGRLEITNTMGDTDGDGDYDELYAFGGRSFSIWDELGNLIFDSGNEFERITAELFPDYFNSNNDANQSFDNRSDNKGPEPEGITLGRILEKTYAFIGLERIGGIIAYDVTDPYNPFFVDYFNNRNFAALFNEDVFGEDEEPSREQLDAVGDLGPEGLLFIAAADSPTGRPLLAVANEVSGTTTLYSVRVPEPSSAIALAGVGALGWLSRKRKRA